MIDMALADGYEVAALAAINGARPEPELHIDTWSEQHMVLPKSSSEPGPYRISRMYPSRRVLQCLSPDHPARRVVIRGASQMLKTQCGLNAISAWIHRAPANILALEPTDKLAKRLSSRIQQAARDVDALRRLMPAQRSRDARNTMDAKEYPGGTLYIATAGAAANLAEIPARYLFLDEVDRMEMTVDGEGDPVEIAEARTTRFSSNCKIYAVSSPTVPGFSKIDQLFAMGTQEAYYVPCPHCLTLQHLVVENFRYSKEVDTGNVNRAWFVCPECGCEIDEHHKGWMLRDVHDGGLADWKARSAGDGETVSFEISAYYSPFGSITWLQLGRQFDRAKERKTKGDREGMRVFFNTRLALSYSDADDNTSWGELKQRAEAYPQRVVPFKALVLTMAVDVQGNRLEVQIEAWGPGLEHWPVDFVVLDGDPATQPDDPNSVWARLDELRSKPLLHESGVPIYISAYGIDSGGHHTQDVYNYGFSRRGLHCRIFKGASRPNRPICGATPSKQDIDWGGRKLEGAAELWIVGTDVAKDHLYNRMRLKAGDGAMHMPKWAPDEWFKGLVAEQRVTRYRKGRAVTEYVKASGDRNEPLDLTVYNLALAHNLGLHRWSRLDWDTLRGNLIPQGFTPDMFDGPGEAAAAVPVPASGPGPGPEVPAAASGGPEVQAAAAGVGHSQPSVPEVVPELPKAPALEQVTPRQDQPLAAVATVVPVQGTPVGGHVPAPVEAPVQMLVQRGAQGAQEQPAGKGAEQGAGHSSGQGAEQSAGQSAGHMPAQLVSGAAPAVDPLAGAPTYQQIQQQFVAPVGRRVISRGIR